MIMVFKLPFFRRPVRVQESGMANPQDKFDNTKPLGMEAMNKTSFGRWIAEAQNEVIIPLTPIP